MKIKTSELTGAALDWAVAKCEGFLCDYEYNGALAPYSTTWEQGGPIIERKKIDCLWLGNETEDYWRAEVIGGFTFAEGETPLIAAMRCYVASKLGDEVEIPNELNT